MNAYTIPTSEVWSTRLNNSPLKKGGSSPFTEREELNTH
jgi:hypothetical protein